MVSVSTKVLRVFVFAFLGAFLPGLANALFDVSNTADWSTAKAAVVSLIIAAFAGAIRVVVAYLPVFADDNVGMTRS